MTSVPDEVAFSTSGHTGEPVVWLRTGDQLRAEVDLLARTVVGQVDRVVNVAPPRHLYGYLFGELLPARLGVPVEQLWQTPLVPPTLPPRERTLLVCLPATWVMLRSLVPAMRAAREVVAVHSTGPVTPIARQVVGALRGAAFRGVEILGSTETGAIAQRTLTPNATGQPWTLVDDVTVLHEGLGREQRLRVTSPRLARTTEMDRSPDSLTLDDLVRPLDERRFELLGRGTRMIKINGRRLRLEHVEHTVRAALPRVDLVCVPRRDQVRAEHYDLFYADERAEVSPEQIHAVLASAFPGVPAPRSVRRVPCIPRSATGKVRLDRLLAADRQREMISGVR